MFEIAGGNCRTESELPPGIPFTVASGPYVERYARFAAWLVRDNRPQEVAGPQEPTRTEIPRINLPPRQPIAPRPE